MYWRRCNSSGGNHELFKPRAKKQVWKTWKYDTHLPTTFPHGDLNIHHKKRTNSLLTPSLFPTVHVVSDITVHISEIAEEIGSLLTGTTPLATIQKSRFRINIFKVKQTDNGLWQWSPRLFESLENTCYLASSSDVRKAFISPVRKKKIWSKSWHWLL